MMSLNRAYAHFYTSVCHVHSARQRRVLLWCQLQAGLALTRLALSTVGSRINVL